jgi:drug/metabolite transporter (DMT)-like permease
VTSLITANYFVCVVLATFLAPPDLAALTSLPVLGQVALGVLGMLFISVFVLTGLAARQMGVGLAGMLAKLSVVWPVAFAAIILREPVSWTQVIGIVVGVAAIGVVHAPYLRSEGWKKLWQASSIGLLLWLGNGLIDIIFKAAHPYWKELSTLHVPLYIMAVAGLIGLLLHVAQAKGKKLFSLSLWKGAFVLGATNLLSIFFYLRGLEALPAVQFFLWNNLGIVLLSGMVGLLFFRERFSWEVGVGYALGLAALLLVS